MEYEISKELLFILFVSWIFILLTSFYFVCKLDIYFINFIHVFIREIITKWLCIEEIGYENLNYLPIELLDRFDYYINDTYNRRYKNNVYIYSYYYKYVWIKKEWKEDG